jgi:hypothetical protein
MGERRLSADEEVVGPWPLGCREFQPGSEDCIMVRRCLDLGAEESRTSY